jgi:hypothetical protein
MLSGPVENVTHHYLRGYLINTPERSLAYEPGINARPITAAREPR